MNTFLIFFHSHKFVLAYLPVVAFYHWGKVIYKFKLEDSYDSLVDQIVKMTGKYMYCVSTCCIVKLVV